MCCASFNTLGGEPKYECKPSGNLACLGQSKMGCDDKTDCPSNNVCCATLEQTTGLGKSECKTQCKGSTGLLAGVLCDPNASPKQCEAGLSCLPSQAFPGYFICK